MVGSGRSHGGGGGLGELYKFRAVLVHVRQNTCVRSITSLTIFYLDLYFLFIFFLFFLESILSMCNL